MTMSNIEQDYEDFISTVSHELRTPLTSIRGFSQTMLSSWEKLDDESKKKFIKIIEEQSNRLIHLVENMLAVTKLKTGGVIVYNELDIKPVIEQTVAIVKNQYSTQKFDIKIQNNLPKIFVDKDKFQQIMTNLIENSAKYSPESSTTTISAISAMKVFAEIYVMTKGGPLNSSKTIVYYIYERAFENLDLGYASAMAVVLLAIVMIFSLINIFCFERNKYQL